MSNLLGGAIDVGPDYLIADEFLTQTSESRNHVEHLSFSYKAQSGQLHKSTAGACFSGPASNAVLVLRSATWPKRGSIVVSLVYQMLVGPPWVTVVNPVSLFLVPP